MYFAVFHLLLLVGLSQADVRSSEEAVLRRVTRNALHDFTSHNIPLLESVIIDSCKANGQVEAADNLPQIFDDMKSCLKNRKILVTPKRIFLELLEECTSEALNATKSCLPANQKYFPDLALDVARSRVNFIYDNFRIIRTDLLDCYPKLGGYDATNNYKQCLNDIHDDYRTTKKIAPSKTEFCKSFISSAYCFTNLVKQTCEQTTPIVMFRQNFLTSYKSLCEENEV